MTVWFFGSINGSLFSVIGIDMTAGSAISVMDFCAKAWSMIPPIIEK